VGRDGVGGGRGREGGWVVSSGCRGGLWVGEWEKGGGGEGWREGGEV